MKKAFLILSLLGSLVASADDSYLYWMIDTTADFAYAKIRADGSDTYLNVYDGTFTALSESPMVTKADYLDAKDWGDGFYAAVSGSVPSTFIVELWNAENAYVGFSSVSSSGHIYSGGMGLPAATAATASSFAIPEPSSGLLMLVGCAVLGLRRRKQKNA